MKKALAMLLSASMVLSLAACGSTSTESTETTAAAETEAAAAETEAAAAETEAAAAEAAAPAGMIDDTLRIVQPYDPGTFEIGNNDEQSYNRIMTWIYDPLFRYDEDGNLQNWLVDTYSWDDPTHLRITLKDGIKFSDGTPLTAEDVVWTFQYEEESNLPNFNVNIIDTANCTVEDDLTCVIALKYACGTMPNHLANSQCVIGCKHAYEDSNGDWLGGAVVGTGPYKLVSYTQGDVVNLTANENYWQEGKPHVKNVECRVIPSGDAKATEAKTGNYDLVFSINAREYDNIDNTPGMHMQIRSTAKTVYLLINEKQPPMDNPKIREAFARAIDVKATVTLAYGKVGCPAEAFIIPGIAGSNSETYRKYFGEGHDIEAAKQCVTDAGYPDGVDLEFTVESSDEQRCDMAEAIQAQVADAGIRLSINKMEMAPLREYMAAGKHQMCIYGFTACTMEADGFLSQIQPGSDALARIGYENQDFFDKYQEGCAETDAAKREAIWEECLEMLMSEYCCIPLNAQQLYVAVNDRLDGVWLAPDYEQCYLEDITIKQ